MGATNEGQPQFAASRMGVGPLHIIDEVTEGNVVMEKRERQEGNTSGQAKGQTQRWQPLQPNLERVNEAARRSGQTQFTALLHHVDVAALERAFRRQRRAASPGIDRVKVEDYERNLEVNLQRLHARIHSGQYWPKPVRRTYIPKADGSLRPLGIPTLEDKIVQGAVAEVLNAVYEADFLGFSYGFRPERSPHSALAALDKALMTQRVNFVLDLRRRAAGTVIVCRYADDMVFGCQFEADGKQLLVDLKDRLLQFGLSLHEGKTRLIEFGRYAAHERTAAGQRRPETFDFLGFTHYCARTRKNKFMVKRKTQAKRLARKLKAIREEMKHRMHAPLREQHRWLRQVLNGHYQYFGVIFNYRSLRVFKACAVKDWRKVLGKRSQKGCMNWATYRQLLIAFPLPEPVIHGGNQPASGPF
jgi:uncharacterized protein YcbK (DUF882 family)